MAAMAIVCASLAVGQQKKKSTAPAPTAAATPAVYPLAALRIEGNKHFSKEKIIAVTGLKLGEPVLRSDFDHARQKLLDTGAFESVSYEFKPSADGKAYDGTLRLEEVDQVFPYRFEDLPVSEDVLRAAIRKQEVLLGDEIPATKDVIDRYVATLEAAVDNKVKITGKLMTDVPGRPAIIFRPPAARLNIAEVHFKGNEVLPTTLLANTLAGVAVGVPYSDVVMQQLLDGSIRPLYDARGRIAVTFPKLETQHVKTRDLDGISVTITVAEGESYNLGKIRIVGVNESDAESLEGTAKWRTNDVANFDDVREGTDRILKRLRSIGFLKVTATTERQVNQKDKSVDAVVKLVPGPQYIFQKVEIVGLDMLTEPTIRKMWTLKEGKPYDPEYPDKFLKNVKDENILDDLGETRSEPHIDEKAKTVWVKITFDPAKPKPKDKDKSKIGIIR
jgi:outer membrane protein insertion porin family